MIPDEALLKVNVRTFDETVRTRTDPDAYRRPAKAERVAEDIPTNHGSKFAPVLHPTLEVGVQALTTASLSYLGR